MSDKAPWGLGNLFGKGSAKPLATSSQKCPSGKHAMSAGWAKCPYCEAERNAGEKTRINVDDAPASAGVDFDLAADGNPGPTRVNTEVDIPADDIFGGADDRRATQVLPEAVEAGFAPEARSHGDAAPAALGVRGATRVLGMEDSPASGAAPVAGRRGNAGRRLTGILVTFSWSPLGRLYELRDGRNYGGSGTVAAEANRECDVLVTEDSTLSSTHFLILCQGGKYRISDCNSTNGTYVEGELVDALGIELVDGARIQAGATLMVFKKLQPTEPPGRAD